jgi:hypothetical protein
MELRPCIINTASFVLDDSLVCLVGTQLRVPTDEVKNDLGIDGVLYNDHCIFLL